MYQLVISSFQGTFKKVVKCSHLTISTRGKSIILHYYDLDKKDYTADVLLLPVNGFEITPVDNLTI